MTDQSQNLALFYAKEVLETKPVAAMTTRRDYETPYWRRKFRYYAERGGKGAFKNLKPRAAYNAFRAHQELQKTLPKPEVEKARI